MPYKFFMISALDPKQAEAELNAFCVGHRAVDIDRQFVADGAKSFWSVCVNWVSSKDGLSALDVGGKRKPKVDYKDLLSADDFVVYSELRNLRKEVAQRDGTAVYNVFTNQQLFEIVDQSITTKVGLLELEGVGQVRVDKYGDLFLQRLNELTANETDADPA